MHLKVLYFAQLREKFGLAEESVQTPEGVRTIADLMQHLGARGGVWQDTLGGQYAFRVAMNQEMVSQQTALVEGAEVAIFRPVTGG
ncbi:MoaD Molybdopterin converting factor, small subunit [Burkholderiaceae bacterium]|jgi:molybdopterin converting factor subunit 1